MILLDTGPIVAFFDASDDYHGICVQTLKTIEEPLATTWPVLTEAFYLLAFSWKAQDNLWRFIVRGGVEILPVGNGTLMHCRKLMEKYKDLPMDLADATLVAVAESKRLTKAFTLDHRDFGIYRISGKKTFELLPAAI